MPRYELSVSPEYVPDWNLTSAIREIFQNALDQQTVNENNVCTWENTPQGEFRIKSKDSKLTKDTLLFGTSTKAKDVKTIGVFGEGYKLAMLVLCRLGKKVIINNYGENEVWVPKIINSKRYKSQLLVVDIKKNRFGSPPDNNLEFVVSGIEEKDLTDIKKTNLHMRPPKKFIETSYGRILQDNEYAGKVFINGLFVCDKSDFIYGYDAKPEFLTIGRDRNLIGDFDLSWLTSKMWSGSNSEGIVIDLLKKEAVDVSYLPTFTSNDGKIAQTMYEDFRGTYGKVAVPVSTQAEYDAIKKGYKKLKPIFVKENVRVILLRSTEATIGMATPREDQRFPHEILEDLFKKCKKNLSLVQEKEFRTIIQKSKKWTLI